MQAIIRQGNGNYYISTVYGYYKDITAQDDYQRYLESVHKPYWIVWDPEKKKLIRWLSMTPNTKYLIPQTLIVDIDTTGWNVDEERVGCVDFLSRELLDSFLDLDNQPEEILEKCRELDRLKSYSSEQEILSQRDIDNLMATTGYFHDAQIVKEELRGDGTLYLRFGDIWGCEVDVWFWGDLEYSTASRRDEDPFWFGSSVILQDGFVYFVDEDGMTVEEINDSYCYFKARHMKYRIIPD